MIKNMFIKKYFLFLAMMMSLLFIFGLGNKKIFADGTDDDWGTVSVSNDYWDFSTAGSVVTINGLKSAVTDSKIIIPNPADFGAGVETVKISKNVMGNNR